MKNTHIASADLNAMVSLIHYFHNKIKEGSDILGEKLDLVSEDMIAELSEFVDFETQELRPIPVRIDD